MKEMVISTVVDDEYACYIPLFIHCCKAAYPEYDVKIFRRGTNVEPSADGTVIPLDNDIYGKAGSVTAALRFLVGDGILDVYENCLITDIDMLIRREDPPILKQHLDYMARCGLQDYNNYRIDNRMPGVHFVRRSWWGKTRESRKQWLNYFESGVPTFKGYDEIMLFLIATECKLAITTAHILWNYHGIHMGRFRTYDRFFRLTGEDNTFVARLMEDKELARMADESGSSMVKMSWANMVQTFKNM